METLRHPTRWRFNAVTVASALVGMGIVAVARAWWLWAATPFLGAAVAGLVLANHTRCPRCGRVLTRARRETAFTCYRCRVEWQCGDWTN